MGGEWDVESRRVFAAIASLSSGRPPAGVYRCQRGSPQAARAASTMYSGVGKSGSPALRVEVAEAAMEGVHVPTSWEAPRHQLDQRASGGGVIVVHVVGHGGVR